MSGTPDDGDIRLDHRRQAQPRQNQAGPGVLGANRVVLAMLVGVDRRGGCQFLRSSCYHPRRSRGGCGAGLE